MLKDMVIVVALVVFLVSIVCIYNARGIVRNKVKVESENNVVVGLKVVGYILCMFSLFFIYYLK